MQLAFPWPTSNAEWIAFGVAAFTLALGLLMLFAPGTMLKLMRLQTAPDRGYAQAEIRGRMAGFYLGLSLTAILLAQPLLYLALGFSWLFTAFGRLISMLSDEGFRIGNLLWLAVEAALGLAALGYSLGWLS